MGVGPQASLSSHEPSSHKVSRTTSQCSMPGYLLFATRSNQPFYSPESRRLFRRLAVIACGGNYPTIFPLDVDPKCLLFAVTNCHSCARPCTAWCCGLGATINTGIAAANVDADPSCLNEQSRTSMQVITPAGAVNRNRFLKRKLTPSTFFSKVSGRVPRRLFTAF